MTTIIMIRHGESLANKEGKFAGHSDYDLSDLGREQAKRAGEYIKKHYKVDAVYASDLKRAFNTGLPTAENFGLEVIADEGLRELHDRIVPRVLEIAKENDGKTVVIATHSTPVRAFECYAMGLPPEQIDKAPTPVNASICVFKVDNGRASVEKFNITEHIEDMITKPAFKY